MQNKMVRLCYFSKFDFLSVVLSRNLFTSESNLIFLLTSIKYTANSYRSFFSLCSLNISSINFLNIGYTLSSLHLLLFTSQSFPKSIFSIYAFGVQLYRFAHNFALLPHYESLYTSIRFLRHNA